MSLQIEIAFSVPKETARVAQASFPKGNVYMTMRDQLGTLFEDEEFADLFPPQGQPAEAPWRLALVTVMQFAENLPDRQAADAVRSRIDWKYAMGLELTDDGFDFSILSEFRQRLLQHGAEQRLFDLVLTLCRERNWLKARGKQRTDSTHVLAAIHTLNRLENAGETLRHTLDVLAEAAPDWLRENMQANGRTATANASRTIVCRVTKPNGGTSHPYCHRRVGVAQGALCSRRAWGCAPVARRVGAAAGLGAAVRCGRRPSALA